MTILIGYCKNMKKYQHELALPGQKFGLVGWLVLFYVPSTARSFRDGTPIAKDVKLGFYTVPTGNRTPGHRLAVHYTTTAPCKLTQVCLDHPNIMNDI